MIVRELKRWLSLLLALVMILSAVLMQVFATEAYVVKKSVSLEIFDLAEK